MNSIESPLPVRLSNKPSARLDASSPELTSQVEPSLINVILVEDDSVDSEIVRRTLETFKPGGYQIHQALSLSQAMRQIASVKHDVILLDLGLKDCSSLDALGNLVAIVDAPIVVLTGNDDRHVAFKALELGAADFLSKSDNLKLILPTTIQFAMERYQNRKNTAEPDDLLARRAKWQQRADARINVRLSTAEPQPTLPKTSQQSVAIVDEHGVNWVNQSLSDQLQSGRKPATISEAFPVLPPATVLELEQAIHECKPFRYAWLSTQQDNGAVLNRVELQLVEQSDATIQQFAVIVSTDTIADC